MSSHTRQAVVHASLSVYVPVSLSLSLVPSLFFVLAFVLACALVYVRIFRVCVCVVSVAVSRRPCVSVSAPTFVRNLFLLYMSIHPALHAWSYLPFLLYMYIHTSPSCFICLLVPHIPSLRVLLHLYYTTSAE